MVYSPDDTMCGPCANIKCSLPATLLHKVVDMSEL